jgi:hypothetical protein
VQQVETTELNRYGFVEENTMNFDRSKTIAIVTGAVSLLLGILYLILVQILDFRGEMLPAPVGCIGPWISFSFFVNPS